MSEIAKLAETINLNLGSDPSLERNLVLELSKIVSTANMQAINSDEGYCFRFNLPIIPVGKLPKMMNITQQEIYKAFETDWKADAMKNNMYNNSYYQILLIIVVYGILYDKESIAKLALLIIMFKLWNGRKTNFLKWCDKNIMRYVVSNMCTKRHLFAKYDDPFSLLKNHSVITLLNKYSSEIKRDPGKMSQRLFSQAWSRLHQQWVSNKKEDIYTGKKMAQGGILQLYIKAKEEGMSISSISSNGINDEEGMAFDSYTSISNRDEIITQTTEYITMNPSQKYSQQFLSTINSDTKVSTKVIETILKSIHNHQFYDLLHDIISVMLSSLNVMSKEDICNQTFLDNIKKKVMSSKNNDDARKLQILCFKLLGDIFKKSFSVEYSEYSNVQQIQLRKVIIYGIYYNIRKSICKSI